MQDLQDAKIKEFSVDNLDIVFIAWLYLLAAYLSVLVLVQIVIAILSVLRLFRREQARVDDGEQPEISAVIAAHNEEYTLPITLDSLATQSAPPSQLVVVSDGSTDSTESAAQTFMSNNGIDGSVLTTNRGGKGKALQRGLDEITTPLTCFVDADVEMDPHALERLRRHFVDPAVVAMSVWVWPRVTKQRKGLIAYALVLFQVIEYARAILWRPGWEKLGALSIVEGRLGMFRTDVLKSTHTLRTTSSAIDYALTLEIHRECSEKRTPYKIGLETKATVWTDVPLNLSTFFAQRMRFASGFFRAYALNRSMLWVREYGALGMFELPVRLFTSFFATIEFLLWASCGLLSIAGHSLASTAWTILLTYLLLVTVQLYLSLALSRRFTVYRWPARFDRLLWLMVPLAAVVWEPIKGLANLAGWIKMPWLQSPWRPLRNEQPLTTHQL